MLSRGDRSDLVLVSIFHLKFFICHDHIWGGGMLFCGKIVILWLWRRRWLNVLRWNNFPIVIYLTNLLKCHAFCTVFLLVLLILVRSVKLIIVLEFSQHDSIRVVIIDHTFFHRILTTEHLPTMLGTLLKNALLLVEEGVILQVLLLQQHFVLTKFTNVAFVTLLFVIIFSLFIDD